MDQTNHEDILFGTVTSEDEFDDTESEVSEEMLKDSAGSEALLWDEQLESADADTTLDSQDDNLLEMDGATGDVEDKEQIDQFPPQRPTRNRHWLIIKIEAILERIVDGLLEDSEALTITLKSRRSLSRRKGSLRGGSDVPEARIRNINFPGSTVQEACNFAALLKILELVRGNLIANAIMTKRDIYYRHPELFGKQSVVDRFVDDLACTFDVTRAQLNVSAAAKGLVAGNFSIKRANGSITQFLDDREGAIVPCICENEQLDLQALKWILVIEKEATFRSILSSPKWSPLGSQGLMLTAKGYPDLSSRTFLRHIADAAPHTPILALVDWDPDGIAIMSTYKYGSIRYAHEKIASSEAGGLGLSTMRWLGVQNRHIFCNSNEKSSGKTCETKELQGVMKLTARDRAKASKMLEWDVCTETGSEPYWRQDLQRMLILNQKAEMQILDELPGGLLSWLCMELMIVSRKQRHQEKSLGSTLDDSMLF